jgi:hypothetical protein
MSFNPPQLGRRMAWIGALTASTILGSFVFACATPFAALAALAALFLPRRDALALMIFNWLVNQVIGYGFLHYPQTWDSFAWGGAIGLGALAALPAAWWAEGLARPIGWFASAVSAFIAAFVGYEIILYAAATVLPAGDGFSASVILYVLEVNGAGFAGLLVLQALGQMTGIALSRPAALAPA